MVVNRTVASPVVRAEEGRGLLRSRLNAEPVHHLLELKAVDVARPVMVEPLERAVELLAARGRLLHELQPHVRLQLAHAVHAHALHRRGVQTLELRVLLGRHLLVVDVHVPVLVLVRS